MLIAFLTTSIVVSSSCQKIVSNSNETSGNLSDCKKWFKSAVDDFNKNRNNFVSNYCKLPFLYGSGGDGFYIYPTIDNQKDLLEIMDHFISECKKEFDNSSKISFTKTYVSDYNLPLLCNSQDYSSYNPDGTKVYPDSKPPYYGFISEGETVYSILYNCGPLLGTYDTQASYQLYVVFDKTTKSYKFWAANDGM